MGPWGWFIRAGNQKEGAAIELEEQVMDLLQKGYHCSQVMMQLSMDLRGIQDPFLIRALGALGGGMFAQRACGTLTGAVCVLGSYFPRGEGEAEPRGYQELANELADWFERTFGSLECRDLVEFRRDKIMAFCPAVMARTFEKVLELLEEHDIDPYT